MATVILSVSAGIPTPLTTPFHIDALGDSKLWLLAGVNLVTTSDVVQVFGGNHVLNLQGSMLSTANNGVILGSSAVSTSGRNTLTLGENGAIMADLDGIRSWSGNDKITIAGDIIAGQHGITLGTTNVNATNNSTVTVAAGGTISAFAIGIEDLSGGNTILINGAVTGGTGVRIMSGTDVTIGATGSVAGTTAISSRDTNTQVMNAGSIAGQVVSSGFMVLTNAGTIATDGDAFSGGANGDTVLNSGAMSGRVYLGNFAQLTNSGEINGNVWVDGGFSVVNNSGTLSNDQTTTVLMGGTSGDDTVLKLFNSGTISGGNGAVMFQGSGHMFNSGDIDGGKGFGVNIDLGLSNGGMTLVNSGTIQGYGTYNSLRIFSDALEVVRVVNRAGGDIGGIDDIGLGILRLVNAGLINGLVSMGAGNDLYRGAGGRVLDTVLGQAGDDTLLGGGWDDALDGGADGDVIEGRGGEDVLTGGTGFDTLRGGADDDVFQTLSADGEDTLDGGAGTDLYSAQAVVANMVINLDLEIATGAGTDRLLNIEDAEAGSGNDTLIGDGGANRLAGMAGLDSLTGGGGRDILSGGDGSDRFVFTALSDSGTLPGTRDVITDFITFNSGKDDRDRIDLAAIDANALLAGDQAFVSIGTAVFVAGSSAGKVRYQQIGGNTVVQVEVNNDGLADMAFVLEGLKVVTTPDYYL